MEYLCFHYINYINFGRRTTRVHLFSILSMRQFIFKVLLLFILVILICNVGKLFISPYYGDYYFLSKYKYLRADTSYNMIFMGSSRTYRNIIPRIIDSLNTEINLKSYNLATAGTFNPETYFQYEQFILNKPKNIKFAVVEIQSLYHPSDENMSNEKSYYWLNSNYLIYSLKYIYNSLYSLRIKANLYLSYLKLFVHRIFDFSKYKTLLKEMIDFNSVNYKELKQYQGFYSLDEFSKDSNRQDIIDRRNSFLADTTILQERILSNINSFNKKYHDNYLNNAHLRKLQELVKLSEENNLKLIFIVQPKQTDYDELLAIKENITEDNLIELADYRLYPEFYHLKYSYDIAHLNFEGACQFSSLLSEKLKDKISYH